jgi:hypothetical protein
MSISMFRTFKALSLGLLVVVAFSLFGNTVEACPMCSQSIAEEADLPRAFMYSILFMLGMPATVFGAFGTMLYVKFRQHAAMQGAEVPAVAGVAVPQAVLPAGANCPVG